MVATSCAAVSDVAASATGSFTGERGDVVLIIDPGFVAADAVIAAAEPTIERAAEQGASLKVLLVSGGSASSMETIDLGTEANNGDFEPESKNGVNRQKEADRVRGAAMSAIATAVRNSSAGSTGADLIGAINRGIAMEASADPSEPRMVVLVTGGGVHRTESLDFANPALSTATVSERLSGISIDPPAGVDVRIVGAGAFPGVSPVPDPDFAQAVTAAWSQICSSVRCSVTESLDH